MKKRLVRGVNGHESPLVWCTTLSRNDIVIHAHSPWWSPWRRLEVWSHQDGDDDRDYTIVYQVPDEETLEKLTFCETWLEAAALLRAHPVNKEHQP